MSTVWISVHREKERKRERRRERERERKRERERDDPFGYLVHFERGDE